MRRISKCVCVRHKCRPNNVRLDTSLHIFNVNFNVSVNRISDRTDVRNLSIYIRIAMQYARFRVLVRLVNELMLSVVSGPSCLEYARVTGIRLWENYRGGMKIFPICLSVIA
jgi:hypothetical protein